MNIFRSSAWPRLPAAFAALLCSAGLGARAGGVVSDCAETALRAALLGGGTVTFSCSGTITLTNTVVITTPTVLDGTGQQVVLSGGDAVRVLDNRSATTLRNLTVSHGLDYQVAGVRNAGSLTMENCTISDNEVHSLPAVLADGAGGLYHSSGTLTLTGCSFVGNRTSGVPGPAAVSAFKSGTYFNVNTPTNTAVRITNCTFAGNVSTNGYTLTFAYGQRLSMRHCTVAGNTAISQSGLVSTTTHAAVSSCVFGGNQGRIVLGLADAGYNVFQDSVPEALHAASRTGLDPLLGPLADNGGPTLTLLPQAGSPLLDRADPFGFRVQDQRGVSRPQGGLPDIGAVEAPGSAVQGAVVFLDPATQQLEHGSSAVRLGRIGDLGQEARVRLFTQDGSAQAGVDYTALDQVVVFDPGVSNLTLSVNGMPDSLLEAPETLSVHLDPITVDYVVGFSPLSVTLLSDEVGYRFASGALTAVEGQGAVQIPVLRSGDTRFASSVSVTRLGGSATVGADFTLGNSTVSFAANQTNATYSLTLVNNLLHENDETVVLGLGVGPGTSLLLTPSNTVVTIQDNDPAQAGNLGFATNSVRVAEGSGSVLLRVTRTGGTNGVVTVNYTAVAGGAVEGDDFPAASGTLSFEEYETQKALEIPLVTDAAAEPDETFQVVLSAPGGGAGLGTSIVNVQIQDTTRTLAFCDQASIEAAVTVGGTIRFACDGTISFNHRIPVLQGVLLDANGHNVVLSAATNGFFQVSDGASLDLRGLTLSGGLAQGTAGTPNTYSGTGLPGGPGRGGAAMVERAVLRASDCQFVDNQAVAGAGGGSGPAHTRPAGTGGAVHGREAVLDFVRCHFQGNVAQGGDFLVLGAGTYRGGAGTGGGIYATNAIVRLDLCHLEANRAEPGEGTKGNFGLASGGAVEVANGRLEAERTEWHRNSVILPSGNDARGGALQVDAQSVGVIRHCRFFANLVRGGDGVYPQMPGGHGQGAAVRNQGWLVLDACTFHENEALGGAGQGIGELRGAGGGVWNSGRIDAQNCTFHRNHARGGGVDFQTERMKGYGGGLYNQGGWVEILNCTWVENAAHPSHPDLAPVQPVLPWGGGIFNTNGTVRLENSVFDANLPGGSVKGTVVDLGHNLADDAAAFTQPTSLTQTDPLTGPLADLGGPVPTIYLQPGSPARDVAGVTHYPPTDANGLARPQGSGCDLGAVEHPAGAVISGVVRGVGFSRAVPVVVQVGSAVSRPLESGVYAAFVPSSGVYRVTLADPGWVFEPNIRDVDTSGHAPDMDFTAHRFAHVHLAPPSAFGSTLTYAAVSRQAVRVLFSPDVHPAAWTPLGDFTTDANGVLRVPVSSVPATGSFRVTAP